MMPRRSQRRLINVKESAAGAAGLRCRAVALAPDDLRAAADGRAQPICSTAYTRKI